MKKSKKKILLILHTPPPVHGSAIVGGFIKNSRIINDSFDCRYINLGTSSSIDQVGKMSVLKPFRYLKILWQVLAKLVTFRPDLCYIAIAATGPAFYKDALVALMARLTGRKMVYHYHSLGIPTRQDKLLDDWLYRMVLKNTDVILLSQYLYPDIQKYVPEDRVYICQNGIGMIPGTPCGSKPPHTVKHGNEDVVILFLSNLIEAKGIFILIEACRILAQRGYRFQCRFVGGEGDVSAEAFRQKVAKAGLEGMVHYAGRKYGKDKHDEFSAADIFTLPSHYDNFPLVVLEAMQFCIPVVSTYYSGIPEMIEDGRTGFLIPVKNPLLLANKLEELIKDPELRNKMGRAGYEKYRMEFTLEMFEERLKAILEKL
jgi:glycosyltransferase involved in cell wall biosynthesis